MMKSNGGTAMSTCGGAAVVPAFGGTGFISHDSSFIVHRSSFIIHHSSFLVHRSMFIVRQIPAIRLARGLESMINVDRYSAGKGWRPILY